MNHTNLGINGIKFSHTHIGWKFGLFGDLFNTAGRIVNVAKIQTMDLINGWKCWHTPTYGRKM